MLNNEEKSSLLYKHYLGVGESRITRDFFEESLKSNQRIQPDSLWTYGDLIPGENATKESLDLIRNLKDGEIYRVEIKESKFVDVVKYHENVQLTKIDDGTDNSFLIKVDDKIVKNIIPFNFFEDYYIYNLTTADGTKIYFGAGDWIVDTYAGVLTFYGQLPEGVDHNNPPRLSFYEYMGGNGFKIDAPGLDAIVLPVNNLRINKDDCSLSGDLLRKAINDSADALVEDFSTLYGYDGSDNGPGIGVSYERLVPVVYSSTKNNVFAFDESDESGVYAIISTNKTSYENVVFISQKAPDTFNLIKTDDGYSIDDGLSYKIEENGFCKVVSKDESFWIIVKHSPDFVNEIITVERDIPSLVLMYWDEKRSDYFPWSADEDIEFNTGIPIVCYANTIPPSAQLNQVSLQSFNDTISPDYYGPRTATVVVASENTIDNKSADYIVKDDENYDLPSILEKIATDKGRNFKGKILLRAGVYKCYKDLDLSILNSCIIEGESASTDTSNEVFIDGKIISSSHCISVLRNLEVGEIYIEKGNTIIENVSVAHDSESGFVYGDITVKCESAKIINCRANTLNAIRSKDEYYGFITVDECNFYTSLNSSVVINSKNVIVRNSLINNLTVEDDCSSVFFTGNTVRKIEKKPQHIFIEPNNYVTQIGEGVNEHEFPSDMTFPLYHQKYSRMFTKFGHDFPVKYNTDSNELDLVLDHERVKVEDGEITTIIEPSFIDIHKETLDKIKRHSNAEMSVPSPETEGLPKDENGVNQITNLEHALIDIYASKADLRHGKVPIEQLPDSVAYGGLLYVGNWSFEEHNGNYPTFEDVVKLGIMDRLSRDENVNEMQPGWFFIVEKSIADTVKVENINNLVYESNNEIKVIFTSNDKTFQMIFDKSKGSMDSISLYWSDDNYATKIASYSNVNFNPNGISFGTLYRTEQLLDVPDIDTINGMLPWGNDNEFTFSWAGDDVQLNGVTVEVIGLKLYENDNPTKEQVAVDGVIYTAGDWLIYTGYEATNSILDQFENQAGIVTFNCKSDVLDRQLSTNVEFVLFRNEVCVSDYLMTVDTDDNHYMETCSVILDILDFNKDTRRFKLKFNRIKDVIENHTVVGYYPDSNQLQFPLQEGVIYQYSIEDYENGQFNIINESTSKSRIFTSDVLSNPNNWEKIDRSYDDPVYSQLPSHTVSRTDVNRPWKWTEGGKGAEDLSSKTIAEALEILNNSIKKLEPKRSLNISKLNIKLTDEDSILGYKEFIDSSNSFSDVKKGFDLNERTEYEVNCGERNRFNSFYLGDSADVTVFLNGNASETKKVEKGNTTTFEIEGSSFEVDYTTDLYDDSIESCGKEGYWNAAFFSGTISAGLGNYRLQLNAKNIIPDVFENEAYNETSNTLSFTTFKPLSYKNNDYNDIVTATATPSWEGLKTLYLNGIRYIESDNKVILKDFRMSNVSNNFIPETGLKIELWSDLNPEYRIELNNFDYSKNADTGFINISKSDIVYTLPEMIERRDSITFYVTLYDFYGESKDYECARMNVLISNISVDKRVINAGAELYPDILASSSDAGTTIDHRELIKDFNLQNAFDDVNLPFNNSYKWPAGEWTYNNNVVSYEDESYKRGLVVNNKSYRFILLDTGITLNEASGFTVKITTDDETWTIDKFSGSTNGLILQARVVDGGTYQTPWLDCNAPIGPYSKIKDDSVNGHPAMFAGSSTATMKRVSFGRSTISGKLYLRVGITNDKMIRNVEVLEVV